MGPFLEYKDYITFIELTDSYESLPRGFASYIPALTRLMHGIICIALHVAIAGVAGINVYFCGKPEFIEYKTIFHRLLYFYIAMFGQRMMYYALWCFQDASMIACGVGYNGMKDKKHTWDKLLCIKVLEIELG